MKDGVKYIVGKQIAAVIVARSKRPPHHQVFLVFPDGSRFEFWGENFSCCSGLDRAEGIDEYVKSGRGEIVQAHMEPPAPDGLVDAMTRDLQAWELARSAISRARRPL